MDWIMWPHKPPTPQQGSPNGGSRPGSPAPSSETSINARIKKLFADGQTATTTTSSSTTVADQSHRDQNANTAVAMSLRTNELSSLLKLLGEANVVVGGEDKEGAEEMLSYFVTLLKNLSVKLNLGTVGCLFNEHLDDFPLFSEAVKLFRHDERMIRIAARTITLNVFKVNHPPTTDYLIKNKRYFVTLSKHMVQEIKSFTVALEENIDDPSIVSNQLEDIIDQIYYLQDLFSLGVPYLSRSLAESIMEIVVLPALAGGIRSGGVGTKNASIFLLTQFASSITYPPLLNSIVESCWSITAPILNIRTDSVDGNLNGIGNANASPRSRSTRSSVGQLVADRRVGAVRAGSGGLFGDFEDGALTGGASAGGGFGSGSLGRGAVAGHGRTRSIDNTSATPNEIRSLLVSELRNAVRTTQEPMLKDEGVTCILAFLSVIFRTTGISSDTLKACNLYPRRSKKSRMLMDTLMDSTDPTSNDIEDTDTSTDSILPYDDDLIESLIGILGGDLPFCLRGVTVELAGRVLVEVTATGGVKKLDLLKGRHMEMLKAARDKWETYLISLLKGDNCKLLLDLFDYEASQKASSDFDKTHRDPRILLGSECKRRNQDSSAESELADAGFMDLVVRMWFLCVECLTGLGVRYENRFPVNALREVGSSGVSIGLQSKLITPCLLYESNAKPANSYFIFDQERVLFIEVDKTRLGKGLILHDRPLVDVKVTKVENDTLTIIFESQPLEFATQESTRRNLLLASSSRIPQTASNSQLYSNSYDGVVWAGPAWRIKVIFTGGVTARDHVFAHVDEGARHRWGNRRSALIKWFDDNGGIKG
ncbi:Protein CL16A [Blyttiomyces sp. JEL0837]|nr:Protein CL16A [Blyttiomyces sp. JEL0837]